MMKKGRPHQCPHCRSTHTVSKGLRPTMTMGHKAMRLCRDCGRKFTLQKRGWLGF